MKRTKPTINRKLFTALLTPMLLISTAAFAYAHWYDSVYKNVKMHVGCVLAGVITYKVLSPWDDDLIEKWPPDTGDIFTDTISISTKIFPGWYVWIGFIIQNQGTLPALVNAPSYEVNDPAGVWNYFIHDEYCYGQVIGGKSYGWPREDVPQNVYAWVKLAPQKPWHVKPPPSGDITPPVYLEAYGPHTKNSMPMWLFLKLREDCPITNPFTIEIKIIVHAVLALP